MEVDKKSGLLICNVCGHDWAQHGLGGNCVNPPVKLIEERMKNVQFRTPNYRNPNS